MRFNLHSYRFYGQPKLAKPKELRGIKQSFSVDYIPNKCRCPVFINENDVWVQHKDYFSESMELSTNELGMPLNPLLDKYIGRERSAKFIYEDAWGDIVLRNEAWIRVENIMLWIGRRSPLKTWNEILRQQETYHGWEIYSLCSTDMERFWERVVMRLKEEK